MKKIVSLLAAAALAVSGFILPDKPKDYAKSVKASGTAQYTIEDVKNLQDFLLTRDTPDLSGKDYDLDNDGVWSVFDLCLMKRQCLQQSSTEKTLIAYFSLGRNSGNFETADATSSASIVINDSLRYGTTEYMANLIQQQVGGDLYSIEVTEPYSQDFDEVVDQNHAEIADNYYPELAGEPLDISQYDTIYIGYPIWASTVPRAIHTFLTQYDLSGKTVIPFCTHNGYGKGNSETVIANLCPQSEVLAGTAVNAKDILSADESVSQWLSEIGMLKAEDTPIQISVGGYELEGVIYDTPLAKEIMNMMPLTVSMVGYGGREYYGSMPSTPENSGEGQLYFENGDITYCPTNNTLAIFYAQTDRPNLTMEVIPIGKVTSDLSVFDTLGSREDITFSFAADSSEDTLIVCFTLGRNAGNFEETDATSSASITVENGMRYGITEYKAEQIHSIVGGDLVLLETTEQYPGSYSEVLQVGTEEHDSNARPALATQIGNMEQYSTIFIGYPIWYNDTPMAICTFLESYDLSGKTIIPFCTSGGSSIKNSVNTISSLCPDSNIADGMNLNNYDVDKIRTWIDDLGINNN